MSTPYIGISSDRLTQLINTLNTRDIRYGIDFTFSSPLSNIGPNGENTKVTIVSISNSDFTGQVDFYYNRLPLSVLNYIPPTDKSVVNIPTVPFYIHDILDTINTALNINLTTDEVVNTYYTAMQSKYRLEIQTTESLAWVPSYYDFDATIG